VPNITFDDLRLFHAAFEVRFDEALSLWDRAGEVWDRTLKAIGGLKRQHAEPNKVVFASVGAPSVELTAELGRLGVIQHNPDNKLEFLAETSSKFTDIVTGSLDIVQYRRVGLRLMFEKQFQTPEAAAEAVLSSPMITATDEPQFGISSPIVQPEYAFRREDGKNGFSVRFKAETQNFEFTPTMDWTDFAKAISETRHRLSLDIDCYIQAPVSVEKLRFLDWIPSTFHIIKRDGAKVISG
jgi:hypothetical protein